MAYTFRLKCPSCQHVLDAQGSVYCPKCQTPIDINQGGMIQLYRMGNFVGSAGAFSIYLNGQPYGHIGNRQALSIPVPFGSYTIHMAIGMSRRCQDLSFTLTPQAPVAYAKARIKPGCWSNTIIIEPSHPSEMP